MSQHPLARYGAVMGVCMLAGGIAGGVSAAFGDSGAAGPVIVAVTTALAMAVGLWACLGWWRGLDEAAQEAHKWAWWWGSTVGLALAGVTLFTLIYGVGDDALEGRPRDLLLGGAILLILFQTAGYGIAWAVWWLKRR